MNFLKILLLLFLFTCESASAADMGEPAMAAQIPSFFSALQDVPLAPGMAELTDQTASFDKPEGRFAEGVAEMTAISAAEAERFYAETLPQLGWKPAGKGLFRRESEQLRIGFETLENRHYARFTLNPAK